MESPPALDPPKEPSSQAGVPFSRQECSSVLCLLHVWTLTFLVFHSSSNTHPCLIHCGPSKLFQASKSCLDCVWEPSLTVFSRTINPELRVSQVSIMLLEPEPQDTIQTFKVGHRRRHFPGEPWEGMLGSFITYDPGALTFLRLHGSLHIPVQ